LIFDGLLAEIVLTTSEGKRFENLMAVTEKNGFVTATKLGKNIFLLLQPNILLQQPNVLLRELNILL